MANMASIWWTSATVPPRRRTTRHVARAPPGYASVLTSLLRMPHAGVCRPQHGIAMDPAADISGRLHHSLGGPGFWKVLETMVVAWGE